MKRGKPLERKTPLSRARDTPLRRTRLKQVSDRRRDETWEWDQVKAEVDRRDRGVCQASLVPTGIACGGALHPHHVHPVGEGGDRLDPTNVTTTCADHHRWIHSGNRRKATALGLITRRRTETVDTGAAL